MIWRQIRVFQLHEESQDLHHFKNMPPNPSSLRVEVKSLLAILVVASLDTWIMMVDQSRRFFLLWPFLRCKEYFKCSDQRPTFKNSIRWVARSQASSLLCSRRLSVCFRFLKEAHRNKTKPRHRFKVKVKREIFVIYWCFKTCNRFATKSGQVLKTLKIVSSQVDNILL